LPVCNDHKLMKLPEKFLPCCSFSKRKPAL